ncbi:MAG TPA: histidine phosphatase family protein [Solirubrobacteraceae bacterium]|nr:histidine phosphatase family protein [Solirubrobacteraceae bacterium]
MAKTLWLLRHAEAEEPGPGGDFERRLTERGERQARAAGAALARLRVAPEHVLSSPRVRALETARLACESLGLEPIVHQPLGGELDEAEARELLAAAAEGETLLLVGHEPDMSGLVTALTGARVAIKKGSLAQIALLAGGGELARLLRPREIELLGKS